MSESWHHLLRPSTANKSQLQGAARMSDMRYFTSHQKINLQIPLNKAMNGTGGRIGE
jgi:hypothetical protein